VVLGVAALTVVLSVTSGVQDQIREKILGVNAHVIIMKSSLDFGEYREVMIEGAGHWLTEERPHEVTRELLEFLSM